MGNALPTRPKWGTSGTIFALALACLMFLFVAGPTLIRLVSSPFLGNPDTKSFQVVRFKTSDSSADRTLIVFIHGIGGHYERTWEHQEGKVKGSLLRMVQDDADLRTCDVVSIGYPTHQTMDKASFTAQVNSFTAFLDHECPRYRRTVIVAHSMGGLISAYGISLSKLLENESQQATLITLSTPFRGSAMAQLAKKLTNAKSKQLFALEEENDLVVLVNEYWANYRGRNPGRLLHLAGGETRPTKGLLVVKEESAKGPEHSPADYFETFDGLDHFGMASPENTEAPLYKSIKAWVRFHDPDADSSQLGIKPVPMPKEFAPKPGRVYEIPADATVEVPGSIVIPPGTRIVINKGVTIRPKAGSILELKGILSAKGCSKKPIHFDFGSGADNSHDAGIIIRGPLARGSSFENCRFTGGTGIRMARPNPRTYRGVDWTAFAKEVVPNQEKLLSCGGAVSLIGTEQVTFADCAFDGNSAYQGGAIYCVSSRRLELKRCRFKNNSSGYGGGAILAQASEMYVDGCRFDGNITGSEFLREYSRKTDNVLRGSEFACGGAFYGGFASHVEIANCEFIGNIAQYVGGAVYLLDLNLSDANHDVPSSVASSRFSGNRSISSSGGGGLYVDQNTRLALTEVDFVCNASGHASANGGQDLMDASRVRFGLAKESGVDLVKNVRFFSVEPARGDVPAMRPASAGVMPTDGPAADADEHFQRAYVSPSAIRMLPVEDALITNDKCFRKGGKERTIDAIVIHHTSAIGWGTAAFRERFKSEVEQFEREAGHSSANERRFDWRYCVKIFELYEVSPHYLIDRDGTIRRLVSENDIAYHAGKSQMPDGRQNVNEFSVGIELISTHPDDDKSVTRSNAYTPAQYSSLSWLLRDLTQRHHVSMTNIVGHDQIAPGRKKDPGKFFDWEQVRRRLADDAVSIEQFRRLRFSPYGARAGSGSGR